MEFLFWLLITAGFIFAIFLLLFLSGQMHRRGGGDWIRGFIKMVCIIPVRMFWRARYVGFDQVPSPPYPCGLIIVSNHGSGLDPIVIENGVNLRIRWLMGRTMMIRSMGFIWRWLLIIPVDLSTNDRTALRESIRWLQSGGVLGIFPEGGIERPGKQIRPFQAGVGFLVAKARSPVLLIHVSGIPVTKNPFMSFLRPCRARIEVIGLIEYPEDFDLRKISEDLRRRIAHASGWPLCDEPVPGTIPVSPVVPSERA